MKKLIILILLFTFALPADASLLWGEATSDDVSIAANASINSLTAATWIAWIRPKSASNVSRGWVSKYNNVTTGPAFNQRVADGTIAGVVIRATAGGNDNSTTTTGTITANTWQFMVTSWNLAGSPGPVIYRGTLTSPPVNVTSQPALIGGATPKDDSGNSFIIGNTTGATTESANADIGMVMVYNRQLTLGEIRQMWMKPYCGSGCVLYTRLGWQGTGTQTDYSPKTNSGTVGGPTVSPSVPIGHF